MIHLHVHSNHSHFASTMTPEEVALQAKKHGQSAVALTDTNSLSGAIPFVNTCKKLGITPIVGLHLTQPKQPHQQVILLAKNSRGCHSLSQLTKRRQKNTSFRINSELNRLKQTGELTDLIPITPCWGIAKAAIKSGIRIYMEITLGGGWREEQWYTHHSQIQNCHVPMVLTCAARMARKEDYNLFRALRAIEHNCPAANLSVSQRLDTTPEHYFRGNNDIHVTNRVYQEAIRNTHRIARKLKLGEVKSR